ncbi:c-type cytochrome [Synoicihabitans lomoniglobus]|uniref:C-type cytochrome n=1 Tax=Synoicihabitans lomoniglobus TaxID=2909285 RepID=A0AAF0CP94_9BACT|nr:c-type cytochrome [Opitutaceae bacterium LMO-M01]WED63634.1 c-type cytochrome [Opitutaceae bacterium LMO-M01]
MSPVARRCSLLIVPVVIGFAAALTFYQYERSPESSPVSRGGHLAQTAGCFACHGQSENDPRVNFRSGRARGIDVIWEDGQLEAAEVIEWITHGVPEAQRERHGRLLVQMPAYGDDGYLTTAEIDDIAAWALAEGVRRTNGVGNGDRAMPTIDADFIGALTPERTLVFGDRLARQTGCYQCHGELGQGAVANLASFKGYIPGFQGRDFRELTADGDRAEIHHWIDDGHGRAIESGPFAGLAKHFFDAQAIPMPAYAEILTDPEIDLLVEFLLLLNNKGPLDSAAVEAIAETLASTSE